MSIASIPRRIRNKVKSLGLPRTLHDLAIKAVNLVFHFEVQRCVVLEAVSPASLERNEAYRYGFLDPDLLLALAEDPENDMTPAYVRAALEAGDECYGILDGEVLASYGWYLRKPYGWYSRKPTGAKNDLVLRFSDSYAYMHKGFTREAYRGQRLHAVGMALAMEEFRARGLRGLVSLVASNNFSSLKSCYRMGYRDFGAIVLARAFGRTLVRTSRGCRKYDFALEHRPRPVEPAIAAAAPAEAGREQDALKTP
jgi:hypothetical protein